MIYLIIFGDEGRCQQAGREGEYNQPS